MSSHTRRKLQDFDNQHDFERMATDVLSALGYSDVEPMAPAGGPDGGRDIVFKDGGAMGVALVTLDKNIAEKFRRDLTKQADAGGLIALFCNVDVSPTLKLKFNGQAMERGYRIQVFDLERLRGLLDNTMKDLRRRYLQIDDEPTERLRLELQKLLRFPETKLDAVDLPTQLERLFRDKRPGRLFDLLMGFDERLIQEVPGIGPALHVHLISYYNLRQRIHQFENGLLALIGPRVSVGFAQGWVIYRRYALLRFSGISQQGIIGSGDFLNYDITWDDAERVYRELANDVNVTSAESELISSFESSSHRITELKRALFPDVGAEIIFDPKPTPQR